MGFLDKLKDAGKGALKGALTMAATSYGTTTGGKHKLCKTLLSPQEQRRRTVYGCSAQQK